MFTKFFKINILSFIILLSIALSLLNFNVLASDKLDLQLNKKDSNELSQLLKNIQDKDKQKPISQKLVKNINNSNELNSDQADLKIKFNLKDRKVNLSKQNDDISISIPENSQINSVDIVDNKIVYSGKTSKTDILVESIDGGVRQVINIKSKDAPNFYDFKVELKLDYKISINTDGSAVVTKPNPNFNKKEVLNLPESIDKSISDIIKSGRIAVLSIAKPWAVDANKKDLKTWYTVEDGNTLRQHIELANAAFPVVADPTWCGNQISRVQWAWRNIYSNTYNWSLEVVPTYCGRFLASDRWDAWTEVYNLTPRCSRHSGNVCVTIPWNKQWNTSQYWSMYNQFVCHYSNPLAQVIKGEWNLEPWRSDVGLYGFYIKNCNP